MRRSSRITASCGTLAVQQMEPEEQGKRVIRGISDCNALAWQCSPEKGEAAKFWPGSRGINALLAVDIQQALQLHLEIMARLAARSQRPAGYLGDGPFDLAPSKHLTLYDRLCSYI